MYIVPIQGDLIEDDSSLPFKVLSIDTYKTTGPAVVTERRGEEGTTDSIDFKAITKLGKSHVELVKTGKGFNVLFATGSVKRKYHLPQPGDTIAADVFDVGSSDYVVKKLKLGVKNQLTRGLIIEARNKDSGDDVEITLGQITDIDQMLFNRKSFLSYYSDYREKVAPTPGEGT